MLSLALCTVFFCFLYFEVSLGLSCSNKTQPTVKIWYINGSSSECPNGTNDSCCFSNLDEALDRLQKDIDSVKGVSFSLGKGDHFMNRNHSISSLVDLSFSSASKNANDTKLHVFSSFEVSGITNLSMMNLTFVLEYHEDRWKRKMSINCCCNVEIKGCIFIFNLTGNNILIVDSIGVTVSHSHFLFSVPPSHLATESQNTSFGFYYLLAPTSCCKTTSSVKHLQMSHCVFRPFNPGAVPFYGYHTIAQNDQDVLQKRFVFGVVLRNTDQAAVEINDTNVTSMVYGFAVPVHLKLFNQTNSRITLERMTILDNKCFSGCGLLIFILNGSQDNSILIRESRFSNNTAVLEGGAVFILHEGNKEMNTIYFGDTVFEDNRAYQYFGAGSGVMVFSMERFGPGNYRPQCVFSSQFVFENCQWVQNHALQGAVFVKDSNVIFNGTSSFTGNAGGAIHAVSSNITLSGSTHFINNTGVFGGALRLNLFSHAHFAKITDLVFKNNSAIAGGAIFADLTTSSETYVDLVNNFRTERTCFITEDEPLVYDFSVNSMLDPKAKVRFLDNTAYAGDDMYVASLYLCDTDRMTPNVSLEFDVTNGTKTYPVSTDVTFMMFTEASCICYKDVKDVNVHFDFKAGTCKRRVIADQVESIKQLQSLSETAFNGSEMYKEMTEALKCSVYARAYQFSRKVPLSDYEDFFLNSSVSNLLQPFWAPFGSCYDILSKFKLGSLNWTLGGNCSSSIEPSDIILHPSPGETFELLLDPRDQFFQSASIQASMQITPIVNNESAIPEALLRVEGTEYGWKSRYYFSADQSVSGLSLVGLVGAKGYIYVTWSSIFQGKECGFRIGFELAPCHGGFTASKANADDVTKHIQESKSGVKQINDDRKSDPFVCQCSELDGVSCNKDGSTLEVQLDVWVGYLEPDKPQQNISKIENASRHSQRSKEFGSHFCLKFCNLNSSKPYYYYYNDESNPNKQCIYNHSGVMCGGCPQGTSLSLVNLSCQNCSDWKVGLTIIVTVIFAVSVIYVLAAVFFRLIGNSVFSSWLFYAQVLPLFVRPDYFSDFSFDFSLYLYPINKCVLENLTALERLAVVAALQLIFVFVLLVVFLLTHIRRVAKYIKLSSVMDAFLSVLAYVYFPIAEYACFAVGCSVFIGNQVRLLADPTVQCFDSKHIPYAVVAFVILVTFVIPFPLVLIGFLKLPRLRKKAFSRRLRKACAQRYKEGREWWVAVSFLRRFILVMFVAVAAISLSARLLCLAGFCLVMMLSQIFMQPYKKHYANIFETAVLANLFLFAGLNLTDPGKMEGEGSKQAFIAVTIFVGFWPHVIATLYGLYLFWNKRLVKCYHWAIKKGSNQDDVDLTSVGHSSSPKKLSQSSNDDDQAVALLRDPLLDDRDED